MVKDQCPRRWNVVALYVFMIRQGRMSSQFKKTTEATTSLAFQPRGTITE